jgi:hypothetical protein
MHSLIGRLAQLEQHISREAWGYQITRVTSAGEVLQAIVMVSGHRPGMATRYFTPDGFRETFPNGRIAGGVILTDDGREPAPNSLAATWREAELER